ncbi:hypothetical protein [Algoriphagus boritolerans]|uniref:Type I phosphodiesterase / nucleotide pyrophosphatase n=1 Tax=Algoriphagus boritolerans DSM 17298 = JCM 18970 TaxID=1120964 RepID=A0A1H5YBT3_9BACT|nr:hypothetical protein [Algoriphagus boritolerans]SEG21107.1 hypothetical protein SAMN03080598_02900 [Algoriphagus boritolerans DSM 17298 = JCM 18970]
MLKIVLNRMRCFLVILLFPIIGFSREKKVVFVLLDAIPASELEQLETPNLDQIAKIGVERNAVNIWKSFKK